MFMQRGCLPVGSSFRRYPSAVLGYREASGREEQSQSHHHCSLLPSESVFRPWEATNLTGVCTKIMWSITWLQALTIQTFCIKPLFYEVFYFHAGPVIDKAKGYQSLLRLFLTWKSSSATTSVKIPKYSRDYIKSRPKLPPSGSFQQI